MVSDDSMGQLPSSLMMTSTFQYHHNVRASHHAEEHPEWDDETSFQRARMDVLAVYQKSFEESTVPALLVMPLSEYREYDAGVDASIDIFFSTCSFRYGHLGVSAVSRLLDAEWEPLPQDPIFMRDLFNDTERLVRRIDDYNNALRGEEGIGKRGPGSSAIMAVLRGLTHDPTHSSSNASFVDDMSLFMAGLVAVGIVGCRRTIMHGHGSDWNL